MLFLGNAKANRTLQQSKKVLTFRFKEGSKLITDQLKINTLI